MVDYPTLICYNCWVWVTEGLEKLKYRKTFIYSHISTNNKTANQPKSARLADITQFLRLSFKSLVLAFVILLEVGSPNFANAYFGSVISSILTNTSEAADASNNLPPVRTISSQNIALLLAPVSSDPNSTSSENTDINIVGDSALMADSGPLGTIADVDEANPGVDTISIYTVRSGDTIQSISKMFGVSVNTILWGNDLSSPKSIKIGQDLVILPINGIKYTIKKGDTVASIAKKYKGDADEIISFNNLDKSQKLVVGDEIIIPNGEVVPVAPSANHTIKVISKLVQTYIDQTIDSLSYFIAPIAPGHYRETQGLHGKNGVDLGPICHCAGKEPLLAAAAGNVLVAKNGGWNGGYGNYVVIAHPNGTQTLYGHMYSVAVHSGETVSQGEQIGYVGSSGNSTGPHVHFEIRGAKNPF